MENQEFRAFWSVIPATVLDDMSLPANAKILYGVLSSLMRREGYCWPSNAQLASAMHCSEDVIRRWLAALSDGNHIRVEVTPNRKTGGKIRYISPVLAEPVVLSQDGGYRDKQPGTYRDKNPGVPGQTSRSLYIDGLKKDNKKRNLKEKAQKDQSAAAALIEKCEPFGMEVVSAMQSFLTMRKEIKRPVESKQAATMLWNKLQRLTDGNAQHMAALLNNATERQWLSIYQLDDDELPRQTRREVDTQGVRFL